MYKDFTESQNKIVNTAQESATNDFDDIVDDDTLLIHLLWKLSGSSNIDAAKTNAWITSAEANNFTFPTIQCFQYMVGVSTLLINFVCSSI